MKPVIQGITLTYVLFNAPYGILVLKLFQMFDYLKLVNVKLPTNAHAFLQWFEENMFDLVPNFLQIEESAAVCSVHIKLRENDLSCLVLNNAGNLIQYYFVYIAAKILILIHNYIWKCAQNFRRKGIDSGQKSKADSN